MNAAVKPGMVACITRTGEGNLLPSIKDYKSARNANNGLLETYESVFVLAVEYVISTEWHILSKILAKVLTSKGTVGWIGW